MNKIQWCGPDLYKVIRAKMLANKEYAAHKAGADKRLQVRFQQAMRFMQVADNGKPNT